MGSFTVHLFLFLLEIDILMKRPCQYQIQLIEYIQHGCSCQKVVKELKKKFINFLFCEASLCSSQIELYYTHKKRKDSFCSSYKDAINKRDV